MMNEEKKWFTMLVPLFGLVCYPKVRLFLRLEFPAFFGVCSLSFGRLGPAISQQIGWDFLVGD